MSEKIKCCAIHECEDYRVPNYCMLKGGSQQNVSEGQNCSFGYTLLPKETARTGESKLEQSVQSDEHPFSEWGKDPLPFQSQKK